MLLAAVALTCAGLRRAGGAKAAKPGGVSAPHAWRPATMCCARAAGQHGATAASVVLRPTFSTSEQCVRTLWVEAQFGGFVLVARGARSRRNADRYPLGPSVYRAGIKQHSRTAAWCMSVRTIRCDRAGEKSVGLTPSTLVLGCGGASPDSKRTDLEPHSPTPPLPSPSLRSLSCVCDMALTQYVYPTSADAPKAAGGAAPFAERGLGPSLAPRRRAIAAEPSGAARHGSARPLALHGLPLARPPAAGAQAARRDMKPATTARSPRSPVSGRPSVPLTSLLHPSPVCGAASHLES